MKTQSQMLAFTTASLLNSSWPFMLLGLLCSLLAGVAFLVEDTGLLWSNLLLLLDLLLALPLAWLSLRIMFDAQIMQNWAQSGDKQACVGFDQSLQALGLLKRVQPRALLARAKGCMRLQKILIILAVVQWIILMLVLACRLI